MRFRLVERLLSEAPGRFAAPAGGAGAVGLRTPASEISAEYFIIKECSSVVSIVYKGVGYELL